MSSNGWTSVMQANEVEKRSFSFLPRKPIYLIIIIIIVVLFVIGFILLSFYSSSRIDTSIPSTPNLGRGYGSRINRPPIINLSEKKLNPVMTDSLFNI